MTLERIRAGEVEALEELLQDAWEPLVRHLSSIAGSAELAEDAAQEALVRLWVRRERWQGGSARALLFRIGRNVALDQVRRREVRAGRRKDTVPPSPSPDEELRSAELRARLESALERLAPRRREVFELIRFAGMTHAEAAEVLEVAPQTVANHMSLALRDLRAELADLVAPEGRDAGGERETRTHDG